jgi:hypothetical protein
MDDIPGPRQVVIRSASQMSLAPDRRIAAKLHALATYCR